MEDITDLQKLLKIDAPWEITKIDAETIPARILVTVEVPEGRGIDCPICDAPCTRVKNLEERRWHQVAERRYPSYIISARRPLIQCPHHKKVYTRVTWKESNFHALLERIPSLWRSLRPTTMRGYLIPILLLGSIYLGLLLIRHQFLPQFEVADLYNLFPLAFILIALTSLQLLSVLTYGLPAAIVASTPLALDFSRGSWVTFFLLEAALVVGTPLLSIRYYRRRPDLLRTEGGGH